MVANRIMLGFDPVLLDSYGAQLMGYKPDDIEYLPMAKEYGVGNYADTETVILELNSGNKPISDEGRLPSRAVNKLSGYIEPDGACSACYAALIYALAKAGGIKGGKIKIGQGYKGKACNGVGIGNCTAGCERYVKGCPPKASDIVEMLKSYF